MRPRKQRRLIDIIPEGINLTYEIAYSILREAEVRDAMNFLIASGNDPKVRAIQDVMDNDDIWQYWFNRDLQVIIDVTGNAKPAWAVSWKVYYLWCRLMVSTAQSTIVDRLNLIEFTPYPPGSVVRFKYLNTITVSVPGDSIVRQETLEFDFREQWQRIYNSMPSNRYFNDDYILWKLFKLVQPESSYKKFLSDRYQFDDMVYLKQYTNVLYSIQNFMQTYNFQEMMMSSQLRSSLGGQSYVNDIISRAPRLIEKTSIIVACQICNERVPTHVCTMCDQKFCSMCIE